MTTESIVSAAEQAATQKMAIGGMPEIERAATDLRAAIDQTHEEIVSARLAARFPESPSQYFLSLVPGAALAPIAKAAVNKEGEAGFKRASLEIELGAVERDLNILIWRLVELRTDLKTSQAE